jgi:magnesium chelatase subunit I
MGQLRGIFELYDYPPERTFWRGSLTMVFPFTAIAGQEEMINAIIIAAIEPKLSGVLIFGDRGTGKSTAVRALAALLPDMASVQGCAYACDPGDIAALCESCRARLAEGHLPTHRVAVPVVDLPLGATEDRVIGALNLERALADGVKVFEPGLLARAHRGFLYIDEVNLLEDHIVDVLLDVAASGENVVEREGMSLRHPARFVLIGSGNPEEGELRPQLLDRFGLCVEVRTPADIATRIDVVRRRDEYDRDPAAFVEKFQPAETALREKILAARARLPHVTVSDEILQQGAKICIALGTDGLRGELTLLRAARALAAFEGADAVAVEHLRAMTAPALRHRLRRDPLDDSLASTRVERAVAEIFA